MSNIKLDFGRVIFESVPEKDRPRWAAQVLKRSLSQGSLKPAIFNKVLEIAADKRDWGKAHDVFSALRKKTLELERSSNRTGEETLLLRHLYLAENVAKVIYNASDPATPFDEDAGWWITVCLLDVLSVEIEAA